jgi:hypothetical protein
MNYYVWDTFGSEPCILLITEDLAVAKAHRSSQGTTTIVKDERGLQVARVPGKLELEDDEDVLEDSYWGLPYTF